MSTNDGAERNLHLYPWYVGGGTFFAWMPVFFLYFSGQVPLSQVLVLEAIYYATVVLFEVPSGYFSDRVGRRPTLIISAAALVAAYACFALASSFGALACGQVLLAVGLAFNSGTDTSFHLATLEELGQPERYAEREARIASLTFAVGAISAIAGGAVGLIDLRLAYALSGLGALTALGAAIGFRSVEHRGEHPSASLLSSLRACGRLASTPRLGWFFAVVVVGTVVNHIPYEFYQPYLERLEDAPWASATTPLVAGLHFAAVQGVASVAARGSAALAERFGTPVVVLAATLLQVGLVLAMSAWVHPLIALLLVLRSVPSALQDAPIRAVVTPHVPVDLRATYLSLQSLVGRLSFSLLLFSLSLAAADVAHALHIAAAVSVVLLALLSLTMSLATRGASSPS